MASVVSKSTIRDWAGTIIGYIYTYDNGDKKATNASYTVMGWYRKSQDITTDEYGTGVARGDMVSAMIPLPRKK